jgi:hypothetical protein
VSDNRLKPKSALESLCHSRSLFGPLQAIPGNGTTEIVAKEVIRNRTTIIAMSATTGIRAATTRTRPGYYRTYYNGAATTRTRPGYYCTYYNGNGYYRPYGVGATTMAIIDVVTMSSRIITVEGSKRPQHSETCRSAVFARGRDWTMAAV